MYEDRKIQSQQMAHDVLGIDGYSLRGKQISPVVAPGAEPPTVVGYWVGTGIELRKSAYKFEQKQITEFKRLAEENGLPILVR